jgi:type I restriction-modification system DNA methylase subunit
MKLTLRPDKNDIPDLLKKWAQKPESNNSWFATKKEIDENDLNLTAGRYKPHVHEEIEYVKSKDIIAEVVKFEDKINTGLKKLMGKIK